jgi:hypothetical protein
MRDVSEEEGKMRQTGALLELHKGAVRMCIPSTRTCSATAETREGCERTGGRAVKEIAEVGGCC